jgi:hypothetical protein
MNVQSQVHIGQVIRNAIVFNFKNWTGDMALANSDTLLQTVQRLFALLDERAIDYVLVGGVALLTYVEGRNTQDIDLIMALSSLERLPEIKVQSQEDDFARGEFEGLQIDILLTRNPLFAQVRAEYVTKQKLVECEIPTATVEGLLLLKLYALPPLYRQGSFAKVGLYENDVATLMHYYNPAMTPLLETLKRYVGEGDMVELRKIVQEIEQRLERFRNSGRAKPS